MLGLLTVVMPSIDLIFALGGQWPNFVGNMTVSSYSLLCGNLQLNL